MSGRKRRWLCAPSRSPGGREGPADTAMIERNAGRARQEGVAVRAAPRCSSVGAPGTSRLHGQDRYLTRLKRGACASGRCIAFEDGQRTRPPRKRI